MGADKDIAEQVVREAEDDPRPDREGEPPEAEPDERTDPVTGSTLPDPTAEESGLPPGGGDPMGGQSPSG